MPDVIRNIPAASLVITLILAGAGLSGSVFSQDLPYADQYPPVNYAGAGLSDPVTGLMERIEAGEVTLEYRERRGYLDSLLRALDIDPSSQLLVFSDTALKTRMIDADKPRAIYFNDEVYIAFEQNSSSIEIAAMDPRVGPVFFELEQNPDRAGDMSREFGRCLRCHDSFGFTGGGVPRFMMSSNLVAPEGDIVSHEASRVTGIDTPINRRWGGWYVTGTHGDMRHLGNLVIRDVSMLQDLDLSENGNKTDLGAYLDTGPYLTSHSDIVALLVAEHQIEVQNAITRVNYDARTLIDSQGLNADTRSRIREMTEPLVRALFMVEEAPLTAPVSGTSGFAEYFQGLGPADSRGRSLRTLDLETRTFEYPLSYLIYSRAFNALPEPVKNQVYTRIREVLTGADDSEAFSHLSGADREVILRILRDTSEAFDRFAGN